MVVAASLLCAMRPAWPGDAVRNLIKQGQTQAGAGQLDAALATLQQAVRADPGSSLAYTRLGGVQVLSQQYNKGVKSFQRAIMLDQGNADAFVGMAIAYLHLGEYRLAREALKEARRLAPQKKEEIDRVLAWLSDQPEAPQP
jgi:tetratricopeptide (TPR) repeat protein